MKSHFNPGFRAGYRRPKYNVPLNVLESDDACQVHVFATGFGKESIEINVVNDTLLIKGKKELKPEDEPQFHIQEFPVRNFERQLFLNGKVDVKDITARHEDGILKIRLPKFRKLRSRTFH
jgi:HSP20 family protein